VDGAVKGRHILVAVDFSEAARVALRKAAERAVREGGRLTVLHVLHEPARRPGFYQRGGIRRPGLVPREQQAARLMEALISELLATHPELVALTAARVLLSPGLPAERIVAVALREGADLIVLGHRPHSRLRRLVWGSVADRVRRRARMPVALVEAGAD